MPNKMYLCWHKDGFAAAGMVIPLKQTQKAQHV
jgi:hypothetical protein